VAGTAAFVVKPSCTPPWSVDGMAAFVVDHPVESGLRNGRRGPQLITG
jgi:hypothetical protein